MLAGDRHRLATSAGSLAMSLRSATSTIKEPASINRTKFMATPLTGSPTHPLARMLEATSPMSFTGDWLKRVLSGSNSVATHGGYS
jgi:hypothetical protein